MSRETRHAAHGKLDRNAPAGAQVAFALSNDRRIDRETQRRIPGALAALDQVAGCTAILEYIELKHFRTWNRSAHLFQGECRHCRQAVKRPRARAGSCHGQFTFGVTESRCARWSAEDRPLEVLT